MTDPISALQRKKEKGKSFMLLFIQFGHVVVVVVLVLTCFNLLQTMIFGHNWY
jgi:hypothetical protein